MVARMKTPAGSWRHEGGHAMTEYAVILGMIVIIAFMLFRVGVQSGNFLTAVNKGLGQDALTSAGAGKPSSDPVGTAAAGRSRKPPGGTPAGSNRK
jgi:Flp pilus assembly pilin Flp